MAAMTAVNSAKFTLLLLGSEVKFSLITFFKIQPMPATKQVRVAASMIVFTSLLSDMVSM